MVIINLCLLLFAFSSAQGDECPVFDKCIKDSGLESGDNVDIIDKESAFGVTKVCQSMELLQKCNEKAECDQVRSNLDVAQKKIKYFCEDNRDGLASVLPCWHKASSNITYPCLARAGFITNPGHLECREQLEEALDCVEETVSDACGNTEAGISIRDSFTLYYEYAAKKYKSCKDWTPTLKGGNAAGKPGNGAGKPETPLLLLLLPMALVLLPSGSRWLSM